MKITQSQLQQIILEEIENVEKEELQEEFDASAPGALSKLEPALNKKAEEEVRAAEKEAGGDDALTKMLLQVLVTKIQAMSEKL